MPLTQAPYDPILTPEEQYRHDLAPVPPRLSDAEEARLIAYARQGDAEAREQLVLSCSWYIHSLAAKYARISQESGYWRIEFLDLVEIGHITTLERLEKALAHANPCGYLRKAVQGAIIDYCARWAELLTPRYSQGKFEHQYTTVSLNKPVRQLSHGEEQTLADILPEPAPASKCSHDFGPIYEALDTLTETQREIIDGYFGFTAQESVFEITMRQRQRKGLPTEGYTANNSIGWGNYRRALNNLRDQLTPVYAL